MEDKDLKKYIIYMFTGLILPTVFQLVYGELLGERQGIGSILLVSFWFFLASLLLMGGYILAKVAIRAIKSRSCLEVLHKIDDIANSIKMPNGAPMFDVLEADYALYESINSKESKVERALRNSHHIVYHSTTAKEDLNWIEYVFWSFLGRVHKEVGCDVIVSLHYDEKARETGLQGLKEQNRYSRLFKIYSGIAKCLIGNDITVIDEEEFRVKKNNSKFFASTFHNKFVKCIVQYANQIANGNLDYKGFMRKISYIESVFPIMVFSKTRMKKSRIYVLDRELAHEIWQSSPFNEFKTSYGLYFITAQTIKYSDGTPVRIFSHGDTVNITDNTADITEKLKKMDVPMKQIMFSLLVNTSPEFQSRYIYNEENVDLLLLQIITEIKSKYQFQVY